MKPARAFVLSLLLILMSPCRLLATEPEFFGRYSYSSKNFSVDFERTPSGIEKLRINHQSVPDVFVIDSHGVFRGTAFEEITIEQTRTCIRYIQLLILMGDGKAKHVSAVYADLKYTDPEAGHFRVQIAKTFEMKFSPRTYR